MSTTMLERTNPLNQLRPAPLAPGRARRVLAELDEEVTELFAGLEASEAPLRERPQPRRFPYRAARNLPKPKLRSVLRITVQRVARPGPATPTEMPRSLTWLPMLRGTVNAKLDAGWHMWLQAWDRLAYTQERFVGTTLEMLRQGCRVNRMKFAAKTRRTVEYYTQAVWADYLSTFGALDGVENTCARVLRALDSLGALAQP